MEDNNNTWAMAHIPYVQFGEKHQSVDFLHKQPTPVVIPFRRPEKGEAQALIETSAKNGPGTFLPRVKCVGNPVWTSWLRDSSFLLSSSTEYYSLAYGG